LHPEVLPAHTQAVQKQSRFRNHPTKNCAGMVLGSSPHLGAECFTSSRKAMEKVWRIVYSAVFFCSFTPLSPQVLLNGREGIELQPMSGELDRGCRPRQI